VLWSNALLINLKCEKVQKTKIEHGLTFMVPDLAY